RLDGGRTRGAGDRDGVVESARLEDEALEGLEELRLGRGLHIHRLQHGCRLQVLDQRAHHCGVVVAVVERTGAGEEVEVFVGVLVPMLRTKGTGEGSRPGPAVAANGGFEGFIDIRLVRWGFRGSLYL